MGCWNFFTVPSNKSFKYFKKSFEPFYFEFEGAEVVCGVQRWTNDLTSKSSVELYNYYSIKGITSWLFVFFFPLEAFTDQLFKLKYLWMPMTERKKILSLCFGSILCIS